MCPCPYLPNIFISGNYKHTYKTEHAESQNIKLCVCALCCTFGGVSSQQFVYVSQRC